MGSGLLTAIIDLDGTLVRCNSFTEFVKFTFRKYPGLRMRLAWIVLLRKLRLISHHVAKERITTVVSGRILKEEISEFVDMLVTKINGAVVEMTAAIPRKILATAAPEIYVGEFARRMGIGEYCATRPGYPENKGMEKLRNVLAMGVCFGEETMVITDHKDDTPLLKANSGGRNIVIGD